MKYITNIILWVATLTILLAANSFAQNSTPATPPAAQLDTVGNVVRIFEPKHASANDLKNILAVFRADVSVTNILGVPRILSVSAPAEIMPAIEDTIKRFDVEPPPPQPPPAKTPTKSVEVSVQVLGAYENAAPSCGTCAIPQSLQPVVTQLQRNFSYKTYLLLDTQLFRQTNYTTLSSINSLPNMTDPSATYSIYWVYAGISPDQSSIQLNSLKFGADLKLPSATANQHFGFETSEVRVPADQQVVIGKTTAGNATIILVIRAKVVD